MIVIIIASIIVIIITAIIIVSIIVVIIAISRLSSCAIAINMVGIIIIIMRWVFWGLGP